ncbi:MAG: flagellar protein FlgN [Marinobacter sp.]|nr:flagellar protein FlgN [Marinobacter sp.]
MSTIDDLITLLNQDCNALNILHDLLMQEKDLLRDGEAAGLESLTKEKSVLLEQVREQAKSKIRLLVQMGYRPELGSPSRYIQSSGIAPLMEAWQAAEAALASCQDLNSVNSRVVTHLQQRLGRLTDIIRGSSGQAKLYGASGEQTSIGQRNKLASA